MSEEEWKERNRQQAQKYIEALFARNGVVYPGTREAYISRHPLCAKEDIKMFFKYNTEKAIVGWLDREGGDIGDDDTRKLSYALRGNFDIVWDITTPEIKEEYIKVFSELFNEIISGKGFIRGMTLERLRVSLQVPLETEYVGLDSAMYSWRCNSPNYSTDCTINFTFIDGRLYEWTKTYLPHISAPTYISPIYDKK